MLSQVCRFLGAPSRVRCFSDVAARFEAAQARLNTLTEDPGNEAKLRIYGLFKQANAGPCNIPKPGGFNFVAKAKYDAWKSLGDMSQDAAKEAYISLVDELAGVESDGAAESVSLDEIPGLAVTSEEGVLTIKLNRPEKFNAITWEMYKGIGEVLNAKAADPAVRVAVLTGVGKWYSAGNDLSNFTQQMPGGPKEMAAKGRDVLNEFCAAMINFPKPLVAAVNGPAIGIPVTTLGLCDLVYCTDSSTFKTPFVSLGQSPEGCSSYVFPRTFGFAKANEMLLTERQITAQEACDGGLVTRVLTEGTFHAEVDKVVKHLATLPPQSMVISKDLIRHEHRAKLLEVNKRECEVLSERWLSDECITAIMKFLNRKKK